jgi:hypothetical protein
LVLSFFALKRCVLPLLKLPSPQTFQVEFAC